MHPGLLTNALVVAGIAALAAAQAQPATVNARQLMDSGVEHERLGQYRDAISDLSQAIGAKGLSREDAVRALFDRGVAYDATGDLKAAVADYSAALRREPAFAPALNNLANAYRRMGRLAEAERDYLKALDCPGASHEYPYFGLGEIAAKRGDTETARDYYRRALAANPAFAEAMQGLAMLGPERRPAMSESVPAADARPSAPGLVRVSERQPNMLLRRAILDSSEPGATFVQLGTFHDQEAATAGWSKITAASGGALDGLSPITTRIDLPGKGTFWRLRAAVRNKAAAQELCRTLVAQRLACVQAWD